MRTPVDVRLAELKKDASANSLYVLKRFANFWEVGLEHWAWVPYPDRTPYIYLLEDGVLSAEWMAYKGEISMTLFSDGHMHLMALMGRDEYEIETKDRFEALEFIKGYVT